MNNANCAGSGFQNDCIFAMTILGEPSSKANSRKAARNRKTGGLMFIKSGPARQYCIDFKDQIDRKLSRKFELITCKLTMHCIAYYGSQRKDLDLSLVMDSLEKCKVIKNDRQIREHHFYHRIDKENPRVEVFFFEKIDDGFPLQVMKFIQGLVKYGTSD